MIHGVIFDFDGTLVDSNAIKRACFFEVARHLPGSDGLLNEILADPEAGDRYAVFEQFVSRHPTAGRGSADAKGLASRYTALCETRIVQAPEIAGASEVIGTLKKAGLYLAISSATPQTTLLRIVAARGMSDFFEEVLGTPEDKRSHIEQVLHHTGRTPSNIVYVGDSEMDQQAALTTDCHFIGLGTTMERFRSRPQHLVSDLPDILPILERMGVAQLQ